MTSRYWATQVVFKSDQQNPVKAVQRELAARRPEMKLENSPTYHSAANDMAENAVQRGIGLTRLLKDTLEPNIKQSIEPHSQVVTFMVNHGKTITSRFFVDQDGKTTMGKASGTTENRDMAEFGEKMLSQPMTKCNNETNSMWDGVERP